MRSIKRETNAWVEVGCTSGDYERELLAPFYHNALKPVDARKLKRWCEAVRVCAEKMLPSSSTTPASAALFSSEALTAMSLPARTSQHVESEDRQRMGEIH